MTTGVLEQLDAAAAEPGPAPGGGRDSGSWRHRAVAAAILTLGLITAAATIMARLPGSEAEQAFPGGLATVGSSRAIPIGTTYPVEMVGELPDVTVLSAEPLVTDGSAAVAAEVVACEPVPGDRPAGDPWDLRSHCARTVALEGLDLSRLPSDAYLMLVAVPLSEGAIEIEGTRFVFRQGDTVRQQVAGVHLTLPA